MEKDEIIKRLKMGLFWENCSGFGGAGRRK
jgi:hypothetical protein